VLSGVDGVDRTPSGKLLPPSALISRIRPSGAECFRFRHNLALAFTPKLFYFLFLWRKSNGTIYL